MPLKTIADGAQVADLLIFKGREELEVRYCNSMSCMEFA